MNKEQYPSLRYPLFYIVIIYLFWFNVEMLIDDVDSEGTVDEAVNVEDVCVKSDPRQVINSLPGSVSLEAKHHCMRSGLLLWSGQKRQLYR